MDIASLAPSTRTTIRIPNVASAKADTSSTSLASVLKNVPPTKSTTPTGASALKGWAESTDNVLSVPVAVK